MANETSVLLAPAGVREWIADAVIAGGASLVTHNVPPEVLVWAEVAKPDQLADLLDEAKTVQWVQLPWAGIEPYVDVVRAHSDLVWTCGKGVYAGPVAEHALMLLLAGLRGLGVYARADSWGAPHGRNLFGEKVTILGGGGITDRLLPLLAPFGVEVTVVRKHPTTASGGVSGGVHEVSLDELDAALDGAIGVVLALALTPETTGIISSRELELMRPDAWLVNVARGRHVVTDDLVTALTAEPSTRQGIGGAALDVTDPEPLPAGHPLWRLPNCIITPHVGNTPEMAQPLLAERITTNLRRWRAGEPLLGLVDPDLGY